MGLAMLFRPKRSKSPTPDPKVRASETEDNRIEAPDSIQRSEQLSKVNTNTVHSFHDVKATSFPPPLSIDAAVFTDPQSPIASPELEFKEGRISQGHGKVEKEGHRVGEEKKNDEVEEDKKGESLGGDVCDSKTCTKENCNIETCKNSLKKQHDSGDKISPLKLTEMINSSIKEAMQTIVQQCRMEEEKDIDKKVKEQVDKSPSRLNKDEAAVKGKQERRRAVQEQLNNRSKFLNNGLRSGRIQEKRHHVHPCVKKLHEENLKNHNKREDKFEVSRSKRHAKSANNVKTDNRRMTGNVNIYICSEATDNTQATGKQKKSQPCTETSSETTTEQSNVSSSKLVTSIRKRRRKSKEHDSFDSIPKREQSDNSNACSCVSKTTDSNDATKFESSSDFIDGCRDLDEDACAKDTESTLIEYQCKNVDISDSDDLSSQRSKFLLCDKFEKPRSSCPSKVSSTSDSEQWSLKTICSHLERVNYKQNIEKVSMDDDRDVCRERVPCDRNRNDTWSLESKSTYSHYTDDDLYRSFKRTLESTCKCKQNRELVDCNDWSAKDSYRCKKRYSKITEKENSVQPWSTCSCIAEEEEDVCVDVELSRESSESQRPTETKKEVSVYREDSKHSRESLTKVVTDKRISTHAKEIEEEGKEEPGKDTETSEKDVTPEKETEQEETVDSDKKEETDTSLEAKETQEQEEKKISPPVQKLTPFVYKKPLRPEARLLKQILMQQSKPSTQDMLTQNSNPKNVSSELQQQTNLGQQPNKGANNPTNPARVQPVFLRKFNLPEHRKLARQPVVEQTKRTPQSTPETRSEEKGDEKQESKEDEKKNKSFQERLKDLFLCRALRRVIGGSGRQEKRSEEFTGKDKVEQTLTDISSEKKVEIPEKSIEKSKLPTEPKIEVKETSKDKEKATAVRVNLQNIIKKKGKPEPNGTTVKIPSNKQDEEKIPSDTISKIPSPPTNDVVNEKKIEKDEQKETSDMTKEKQHKSKLLTIISNAAAPPTQDTGPDPKESKSQELTPKMRPQEVRKPPTEPEAKKSIEVQDKKELEPLKAATRDEKTPQLIAKDHPNLENEATSVCMQCVHRKLSVKETKLSIASQYPQTHESEWHTTCTNTNFTKCSRIDQAFPVEESGCNCCRSASCDCNKEPADYPKSCLKKERHFYSSGSRENGCTIPCHKGRNREDCGCRQLVDCNYCWKAKNDCNCKPVYKLKNSYKCVKSMFCLYCDNLREKCTCRAPIRKCSCCRLSLDLCVCEKQETFCGGRPVLTEPDNDRTMYVTAWKPREEVRRYFSRNLQDLRDDSINECCCYEKLKQHNSDDLPYQRLSVFSDVMNELQQKISESTCCTRCRKVPCCCNVKTEGDGRLEERKIKYCVSPKVGRKIITVCMEKPKSKSASGCKCDSSQTKPDRQRKMIVPVCCACKAAPCRCGRSKSSPKKPKAKCYYCKSSPCVCIASRERGKPRPCRCADSPCRAREKEIAPCGKTSTKPRNNEEEIICVR